MVTNQNQLSPYLGFLLYFHKSQSYTLCNYLIKKSAQLCEELQLTIDHIWSLILVKSNNYSIEGFDLTEINLISYNKLTYSIDGFFYLLCGMFYNCMYFICMYT